jgi:hypothetical protein
LWERTKPALSEVEGVRGMNIQLLSFLEIVILSVVKDIGVEQGFIITLPRDSSVISLLQNDSRE